jgi:ATP-dependent DNA helicase RecQ
MVFGVVEKSSVKALLKTPGEALKEHFGFSKFLDGQEEVISEIVSGRDGLVVMPTGGGKSLCFQIPALCFGGVTLVISPLIALMQDQVAALSQLGVKAAFLNSTLGIDEARRVEEDFVGGRLDLLYVAPERLTTARCLDLISRAELALFAIDNHFHFQWTTMHKASETSRQ